MKRLLLFGLYCSVVIGLALTGCDDKQRASATDTSRATPRRAGDVPATSVSSTSAIQAKAVTPEVPAPSSGPPAASEEDHQQVTVYVTKSGAKYHRSSCQFLSKSKISISLAAAKARYGPCSVCKPPQ